MFLSPAIKHYLQISPSVKAWTRQLWLNASSKQSLLTWQSPQTLKIECRIQKLFNHFQMIIKEYSTREGKSNREHLAKLSEFRYGGFLHWKSTFWVAKASLTLQAKPFQWLSQHTYSKTTTTIGLHSLYISDLPALINTAGGQLALRNSLYQTLVFYQIQPQIPEMCK